MEYNTYRPKMTFPEYGRNVDMMIKHLLTIEGKDERSKAAQQIVNLMSQQNPQMKNQPEYLQKIWDQVHIIADYKLDVDCPFPKPEPLAIALKTSKKVAYPKKLFKYKFYGANVELMLKKCCEMEEGEEKQKYLTQAALFMRLSYRSYNDDKVADELILKHITELSNGKLHLDKMPEQLVGSNAGGNRPPERPYTKKFKPWNHKKNNRQNGGNYQSNNSDR